MSVYGTQTEKGRQAAKGVLTTLGEFKCVRQKFSRLWQNFRLAYVKVEWRETHEDFRRLRYCKDY